MAFGSEMQHGAGHILDHQPAHQDTVAQVALHEVVASIALQVGQIFQDASAGECIKVDNELVTIS